MSIGLYSAIYGGYNDVPKLPADWVERAVMYTDDPGLDAPGWEVRVVNHGIATLNGDPARTAPMLAHKWWKMFAGAGEVDVTIWLDASMTITLDCAEFVGRCIGAIGYLDLAVMAHPWRDCIYDEAAYSSLLPRYADEAPHILAQSAYYATLGHPDHWGLIASGFMIRRNTADWVNKLMKDWWWECITRSHQDQISLPVLLRLADQPDRWGYQLPWHDGHDSWTNLGPHLK